MQATIRGNAGALRQESARVYDMGTPLLPIIRRPYHVRPNGSVRADLRRPQPVACPLGPPRASRLPRSGRNTAPGNARPGVARRDIGQARDA